MSENERMQEILIEVDRTIDLYHVILFTDSLVDFWEWMNMHVLNN